MRSVVLVAGARPNFVKVAPLLRALAATPLHTELVHTGQHHAHSMSGAFFAELGIPAPSRELGIPGAQTARIQEAFGAFLDERRPDGVVVVGDVASTMACALAASTRGIAVAHVEAGLRSFDRTMPEETHRIVTDAISELLFASEQAAIDNLTREGRSDGLLVGNVMIDTLNAQLVAARALPARTDAYVVATLHRPANVDDPVQLGRLLAMLARLADEHPVIFPVHPRTRARLPPLAKHPRLELTDPLGYRAFLGLIDRAHAVVTDSGGIQEETTHLGVPCFTLRPNTERPCTVSLGTNTLVQDLEAIPALVRAAQRRRTPVIHGWDGHAAERVAAVLAARWA